MGFKRCSDWDDLQKKLAQFESVMSTGSEIPRFDSYSSTSCAVVELMDMVKVLTEEVGALRSELSKTRRTVKC